MTGRPCPFCASLALEVIRSRVVGQDRLQVHCTRCGTVGPGVTVDDARADVGEMVAYQRWNDRRCTSAMPVIIPGHGYTLPS